jgi:hypothetical protein
MPAKRILQCVDGHPLEWYNGDSKTLGELRDEIVSMIERHGEGARLHLNVSREDGYLDINFAVFVERDETAAEVVSREKVEAYLEAKRVELRRAEYERLKAEFGEPVAAASQEVCDTFAELFGGDVKIVTTVGGGGAVVARKGGGK